MNLSEELEDELVKQSLYRLVLHEVGHTLGLSHNFKGSTLLSNDELNNKEIVNERGVCSSVMEYPAINITRNPEDQGLFFDVKPGVYDMWAIEFGYTPSLKNPEDEKDRVKKLLNQSSKPELMFGNDSDDMRYPGRGVDPRIMIYDLSDDPVAYAQQRMDVVRSLYPKLRSRYEVKGGSYHSFKDAFLILK